jgi:hypothetical protein
VSVGSVGLISVTSLTTTFYSQLLPRGRRAPSPSIKRAWIKHLYSRCFQPRLEGRICSQGACGTVASIHLFH